MAEDIVLAVVISSPAESNSNIYFNAVDENIEIEAYCEGFDTAIKQYERKLPTSDVAFKMIVNENVSLLQSLISACGVKIAAIKTATSDEKELDLAFKHVRYDIVATDENGKTFNIEMQRCVTKSTLARMMHYSMLSSLQSVKQGEDYTEFKPCAYCKNIYLTV